MSSVYPPLPAPDVNMQGVLTFQKQLENLTRNVFRAWTDFTAANVSLEKEAVREIGSDATEQYTEFRASLRLFEPPKDKPKDSFFVCMIPVLQQVQYTVQSNTVDGVRSVLAGLIKQMRESVLTETHYQAIKQWVETTMRLRPREVWQLYLALMLEKGEAIRASADQKEMLQTIATSNHGANVMTLRLFSEALQVKFLILTSREKKQQDELDFEVTCLGTTQTAAQKYVLLHYDKTTDAYSIYYMFQADGSRRYLFELNRLPAKLMNAYLQLCDRTDQLTDFQKAAPELLLSSTTAQSWAARVGRE